VLIRAGNPVETQVLLPKEGTTRRLGVDAETVGVAGSDAVLSAASGMWLVPLAAPGTVRAPLAGFRPGDRLLPEGPWLLRPDGKTTQLLAIERGELVPVTSLGPARWGAAVRFRQGSLAALLVHDTNRDGHHDAKSGDEADVCVVAPAVRPLTVPERSLSRRLAASLPAMRALLAAEGVAVLELLLVAGPHVQVRVSGAPPELPDAQLEQIRRVQAGLTQLTGDPRLGVTMLWQSADAAAEARWHPGTGQMLHSVRAGEILFHDPKDFPVRITAELKGREGQLAVVARTRVAGAETLDLTLACTPTEPPRLAELAVAPGQEVTATLACPQPAAGVLSLVVTRKGRAEALPWFDESSARDGRDWLATLHRIRRDSGFSLRGRSMVQGAPLPNGALRLPRHALGPFQAPPGFSALEDRQRQKLAQALWRDLARHADTEHAGKLAPVLVYGAGGPPWALDHGGLRVAREEEVPQSAPAAP